MGQPLVGGRVRWRIPRSLTRSSTPDTGPSTAAGPTDSIWFRPDVDGLRAVAIVLVVAYHANLPRAGAGFIGVDIFFVISGFLITRNLLREIDTTHKVSLSRFWARRVRRLVPALALVIVATMAVSVVTLPLHRLDEIADAGRAAALYVSNLYFSHQASDYFAADVKTNPFLHTWSLGVEEQFYILWPLLVAGALVLAGRLTGGDRRHRRNALALLFAVTFAASFAANLQSISAGHSISAFFGLHTRAWEFAAGGLLAVAPSADRLLRTRSSRALVAVAGFIVLLVGLIVIDDSRPYPGRWALFPVVATVLIIAAGQRAAPGPAANPVSGALSQRPAQWLGRVSYSWYLWHWPFIVGAVAYLDTPSRATRLGAALVSLPVAAATYHFYENPIRFARPLTESPLRTFAVGAAITVGVVAFVQVVRPDLDVPDLSDPDTRLTPTDLQAGPGSSLTERVAVAVELYEQRSENVCPKVGAVESRSGDRYCVDGDPDGDRTVFLIGDSHAGQWRLPLSYIAAEKGIRLLVRQHSGCPPFDIDMTGEERGEEQTVICRKQQEGDRRLIEELEPDAVIVSTWSGDGSDIIGRDGSAPTKGEQAAIWRDAADEFYRWILDRDIAVGVIIDEPTFAESVSNCLTKRSDITACEDELNAQPTLSEHLVATERDVLADLPVVTLDMATVVCPGERCRLEVDGMLTYVDRHHLTDAYALSLQPQLEGIVDRILR